LRPPMRTSFHHQLEAQPPNLPVCRTGEPQYPIYRKLDPDILMVEPTEYNPSFDMPVALNGPSIGRILS
jgi:hypothetical protein